MALAVSRIKDRAHNQNRRKKHDQDTVAKRLNDLRARSRGCLIEHRATLREERGWAEKSQQCNCKPVYERDFHRANRITACFPRPSCVSRPSPPLNLNARPD